MPTLFRRSTNITCFFCQSTISPRPQNPHAFRCSHCSCWNRYDSDGEIMSDEPAMHEEALNAKSFAKRASPSKDRLPTAYGTGPFCHTCQTNQMLLVNLLSNYLPPLDDPEYARRVEMLPDYRDSLHLRYPPVCSNCFSSVEDEIKKKDHMARTHALGGWLKESKGKEKKKQVSGRGKEREALGVELLAWKVRGCLWLTSLAAALLGNSVGALGYCLPPQFSLFQPILPGITLISILWTVWDPTYSSVQKARVQGRDVRVQGKNKYITFQMAAWLSRLLTGVLLALFWFRPTTSDYLYLAHHTPSRRSRIYFFISLLSELIVLVSSCFVLRLKRPPTIRLINSTTHKTSSPRETPDTTSTPVTRSSTPLASVEPDLFATLSLSTKPIVSPKPIFGLPSLLSSSRANAPSNDYMDVDDAMDWTPTDPSTSHGKKDNQRVLSEDDDGSWLRPQRFFPPENPTGIEGLFARTRLVDDIDNRSYSAQGLVGQGGTHVWNWWWVYALSLLPVAGIAYKAWYSRGVDVLQ